MAKLEGSNSSFTVIKEYVKSGEDAKLRLKGVVTRFNDGAFEMLEVLDIDGSDIGELDAIPWFYEQINNEAAKLGYFPKSQTTNPTGEIGIYSWDEILRDLGIKG